MIESKRASVFDDEDEGNFDLVDFAPSPPRKSPVPADQLRAVAEASQFKSREPKTLPPQKSIHREPRHHRTGRNVQFNVKARAEDVQKFYALSDRNNWVLGETFERAIAALERELLAQSGR
jgi:hypothetical protein